MYKDIEGAKERLIKSFAQEKQQKPSKIMGERLKKLRKSKNLSREQVAAAIEVPVSAIERIETGNHDQAIETIMRLAMFYEVTLNFIVLGVADS